MKKLLIAIISFFSVDLTAQQQDRMYEDHSIKCIYGSEERRFEGIYSSYYKNGKKKAEGTFQHNQRIGKWTVWDSTGRMRMQRDYTDFMTFKRVLPKVPNDKVIELLNVPQYAIHYNKEGFIPYSYLYERAVIWEKRLWRSVIQNENKILFENNRLFSLLNKNVFNKNIKAYSVKNDEFFDEQLLEEIDTTSIRVIAFKIKEDVFFDLDRLISEVRIIGICPVAVNALKKDTFDLYWIYFPQIRKYLAQEKISQDGMPSKIKTLDDLFYYRYFYGQIYQESNVYDRPITLYSKGDDTKKEAERIEISIIESEHDIWMRFTE